MVRQHRRNSGSFKPGRSGNPSGRNHADGPPEPSRCQEHQGKDKLARCLACSTIFCHACHPGPCPTCGILPVWTSQPKEAHARC